VSSEEVLVKNPTKNGRKFEGVLWLTPKTNLNVKLAMKKKTLLVRRKAKEKRKKTTTKEKVEKLLLVQALSQM